MFYDTFLELCAAKGESPSRVAKKIGLSNAAASGWKNGKTPSQVTIVKLANYFNVTTDYILGIVDFDTASELLEKDLNATLLNPKISNAEFSHIRKYRSLDQYGQKAVNDLLETEYERTMEAQANLQGDTEEVVYFSIPEFDSPMSAGTGEDAGQEYPDNLRLIKEPPPGASYVARIKGDSMEPTYLDGDRVFVAAWEDVYPGQVGVFLMDGKQWIKELGDGELISHNEAYEPRPMTEDIRCQGRVLGVCGKEYLE